MKKKSPETRPPMPSAKEALVLQMLLATPASEMYGLELVSGSNKGLKRGTVYVTLNRMEEKGYIESRVEESERPMSGLPRRLYRATGYGQNVFRLWEMAKELAYGRTMQTVGLQ